MDKAIQRPVRLHSRLYIYRNTSENYWWCAIPCLDQDGKRTQRRRTFRDSRNGGKRCALQAAQHWRLIEMRRPEVQAAMGDQRPLALFVDELDRPGRSRNNALGLVGVTPTFRKKPLGGNFSVTAHGGRKKWFSMRRYGPFGALKLAVRQRCEWVGAPVPADEALWPRYRRWAAANQSRLEEHGLEP